MARFGGREEICAPGYLTRLFHISAGSLDEESGDLELEPPKGKAEVFVIAGGGTGRSTFRRLQREGTAFISGILFQNDLDYPVARALAAEVIAAESFEPIPTALLARARQRMDGCSRVICCRESFGSLEQANRELLFYAEETGKPVEMRKEEKQQWQR